MITYSKKGKRHNFGMNDDDLQTHSEVLWLLYHTPPPVGFNRKPFTMKQQKHIDELFSRIKYPDNYAEVLNKLTGQ